MSKDASWLRKRDYLLSIAFVLDDVAGFDSPGPTNKAMPQILDALGRAANLLASLAGSDDTLPALNLHIILKKRRHRRVVVVVGAARDGAGARTWLRKLRSENPNSPSSEDDFYFSCIKIHVPDPSKASVFAASISVDDGKSFCLAPRFASSRDDMVKFVADILRVSEFALEWKPNGSGLLVGMTRDNRQALIEEHRIVDRVDLDPPPNLFVAYVTNRWCDKWALLGIYRSEHEARQKLEKKAVVCDFVGGSFDELEMDQYHVSDPRQETVFLAFVSTRDSTNLIHAASTKEELCELISRDDGGMSSSISEFHASNEDCVEVPGTKGKEWYIIREVYVQSL